MAQQYSSNGRRQHDQTPQGAPTTEEQKMSKTPRKYPDTEAGIKQCLQDNTTINLADVVRVYPDLVVNGVWAADVKGDPDSPSLIVYLNESCPDYEASAYMETVYGQFD